MTVKGLNELPLANKRVLVRVDFNVPLNDQCQITDDSRIQAALPTLRELLNKGCQLTLMSHCGRPKGQVNPAYSLRPVAEHLSSLLNEPVALVQDLEQPSQQGRVQLLENLRFHKGETANDLQFAAKLAAFGDVYINDAFGTAHRAHASTHAVASHFEARGAGLLMMKELLYLKESLKQPARPFLAILGGSKISDKLKIIKALLEKVDQLMIGGGMSFTFLKAQGTAIGNSLVEEDFLTEAKEIIETCNDRGIELLLPLDHVTGAEISEQTDPGITIGQAIDDGLMGLDIGPETIHLYSDAIGKAKTIVWNGPMGVFELQPFSTGTVSVAEAMAVNKGLTVIGGGDSVAAVHMAQVADQVTHISTGGGASLELLAGHALPGIEALEHANHE